MAAAYPNPSLAESLLPFNTATATIAGKGGQGVMIACARGKTERDRQGAKINREKDLRVC